MFSKKSKFRSILSATGLSFITPLVNVAQALEAVKDGMLDFTSKFTLYAKNANFLRKNLYQANMQIAQYHYENNHIFDAKLRYKMAHLFKKTETHPLVLLAQIAIEQKKRKKAIFYLKKALHICNNAHEREQIVSIINSL